MNPLGAVAALSAFTAIWFGHVAVRKIEFAVARIWLPMAALLLLGTVLESLTLISRDPLMSVPLGIIGITFAWDALELSRQQKRVRRGHAPANPHNPRHQEYLNAPGSQATTIDILKSNPDRARSRDPQGNAAEPIGTRL